LTSPSNLVLLSGDTVVDIDAGTEERVAGLPEGSDLVVWNISAGERVVISVDCKVVCGDPEVFSVDESLDVAASITHGFPAPAPDGVWVTRHNSDSSCTLAKIGFEGTTLITERSLSCGIAVVEESPLGLVVAMPDEAKNGGAILHLNTLETVFEAQRIHAVVGSSVLVSDASGFALVDSVTSSVTQLPAPTDVGYPSYGKASPDGRFIAISFEHPAWPGPRQLLDVWVFEVATLEWTRLPSMPVAAALKATDGAWAPDGRFVLFGSFERAGHALAAWRPGDVELAVREIEAIPSGSLAVRIAVSP
jgi:hypothetical protein